MAILLARYVTARRIVGLRGSFLRLRSHLVVLVLAAAVPLLVFAGLIVRQDLAERREVVDRGMRETVRALSLAVDGEVKTSLAVLETLAASPFLDRADLGAFYEICARAMQSRRGAYVVLFDISGKALLNSSRPYGAPLPNPVIGTRPPGSALKYPDVPLGGGDPVRNVLETGAPIISDLFVSLVTGAPRIGLDIPVTRDGRLRYVLEMSIDAAEFTRLLAGQRPPADAVLALVDRKGLVMARTLDAEGRVGRPLAPELARQIAGTDTGSGVGRTSEGMSVYHVYARSPVTGWTTSLGIASSVALAPLSDSLAILTGGAAIAVVLGLAAALVIGRRITAPIGRLADSAGALARGERPQLAMPVRELEELHAALVSAGAKAREGAEAQAASRAKDEFLAMLSHELRNPLAALSSAAHVLKVAVPSSDAAIKARGVIERQTKHMSRLIGDLLDIGRINAGKLGLERERLDLAEVVSGVVNTWRRSARLERHRVSCATQPVWLEADQARIEQITANLLDNALKFTPAGKTVTVGVKPEGSDAVLSVADEGRGLAQGEAGRVFDLFVSGPGSEGGLGIGLALVRQLAELHGGSVSVASAGPGKGAEFTVRLPSVRPPVAQEPAGAARSAVPRSVLIVEDNDDARQMLEAALALGGHEVRSARDGASGLALAAGSPPDVVLIDIALPDMDGYEVARRLRAVPGGERMGLVAVTGYGQPEDQRRARDAGFNAHLVKPVSTDRLKQVIAELP
jgi:signal transduction histidine kinase/CheY-like chemotaxis protein